MSSPSRDIIDLSLTWGRIMRHKMITLAKHSKINLLQMHVLGMIAEHPGITMKHIAAALMVTAPTATAFIERLVKSKLVKRMPDPANRKLVRLAVTPSGRRFVAQTKRAQKRMMHGIIGVLPLSDQRTMARVMGRLVKAHSSSVVL